MRKFRFRASVAAPVLALVLAAAGGVVAATQSSDEQALQPTRQPADRAIESQVSGLLARMTLEEKLEQIQLLPDFLVTEQEVRNGLGSVLSMTDPVRIRELQRIAVEESRLKIPILFAFDTIHGFRTIFPIPLGAGASFDPQVAFDDHTYGARESAVVGLKQTYAPMVDVSHEPRWGRIAEAAGEDPYLNSVLAAARVKAIQGTDYSAPDKLVAAQSTSRPMASQRAAVTTTPPTSPSSGCGTSTCRRSRRRSTPARTRPCARSTRSTACQAAATTT
jgi:beta-glucosidase